MELSGKVVFITGAAQGLGRAYAEAVLERGAKVFFGDVNAAVGAATLEDLHKRFGTANVRFVAFDVTNHQQFRDAFNQAVSEFDHVDVLVNNAGIMHESMWELMIQINYTSLVLGTKLAEAHMRKDKGGRGGRVINISSITGLTDIPAVPVYCGLKQAVRSYTSSLALQPNIKEQGVEYGILCPHTTATDLVLKVDHEKINFYDLFKDKLTNSIMPLSTVVDAFLELLTLENMNGAILVVEPEGKSYRKMVNQAV